MTDLIEANSMGHEPNLIDIYSASWGPTDDGKTVDGPRNATMRAIVRGVNEVRITVIVCNITISCDFFCIFFFLYFLYHFIYFFLTIIDVAFIHFMYLSLSRCEKWI